MVDDNVFIVLKDEWKEGVAVPIYNGVYNVGRFELSSDFIVKYMDIVKDIRISSDVDTGYQMLSENENTVLYMEHYGIIDKSVQLKMREIVKNPSEGYVILRNGNMVTDIYKE